MKSIYENATPRPWRVDPDYAGDVQNGAGTLEICTAEEQGSQFAPGYDVPAVGEGSANAALIVHAVNNIERLEAINAELLKALGAIRKEAETANIAISLHRDGSGQGRIKVATAMHRIAQWSAATITRALEGEAGNGAS